MEVAKEMGLNNKPHHGYFLPYWLIWIYLTVAGIIGISHMSGIIEDIIYKEYTTVYTDGLETGDRFWCFCTRIRYFNEEKNYRSLGNIYSRVDGYNCCPVLDRGKWHGESNMFRFQFSIDFI